MASVERTEIFDVNIEKFYEALIDFESYHEFVDGVDSIEVLKRTQRSVQAQYSLNLIKKFKYIINAKFKKNKELSWTLDSGDIFKKNDGSWVLTKISANKTEVTYSADIELKVFAPKMILNKLIKTSLPLMMKSFAKRASQL